MIAPDELIVDSFAGGGGASLGISMALGRHPDIAINHDREAIALHAANHPTTQHYAEDVWKVDPVEATAGRPVGLMWLSPDCKHFSKAKGGKPVSKKVRGLAWIAVRWAKAVQPRIIVLENVEEFQTWGPVVDNRPCPQRKGKTFRAFISRLRNLGYQVEWKELRACDYGTPTIRRRLFIIARRDGQPIVWPTPTHGKGRPHPWRTAAECIDWSIPCPSIFERARPLAENTLKRIARGIRKFVIESPRPFIVNMAHGGKVEDIHAPMSTIATEKGGCRAVVAPIVVTTDRPVTNRSLPRSVEEPLPTVTANLRTALAAPVLVEYHSPTHEGGDRAKAVDAPVPTLDTSNRFGLVGAFLAKHYGGHETPGASLFDPLPTTTTQDHNAVVAARLGDGAHFEDVRAFLVAYYGNEKDGGDLFSPLRTLSTRDRFGLVTVNGIEYAIADIGMRMLAPRELYRAQGFPESYRIDIPYRGKPLSKTAQVRMCGNSVVPQIAEALVRANCASEPNLQRAA
jgi:DNA (cytosine-5)-methyltransferase 1